MDNSNKKGGLLPHIRDLFLAHGLDAVWAFCEGAEGAHSKAKRFSAAARFAGNRKQHPQAGDPNWGKVQYEYRKKRDHYEKAYENRHDDKDWPQAFTVAERLYESVGPHFHLASPERDKLIYICNIMKDDCRIGEFPPFDPVECVHTGISWHYRDSSNPYVGRVCSQRGDGCAADINDWDGGNDEEYAYYIEIGRRYL